MSHDDFVQRYGNADIESVLLNLATVAPDGDPE